MCVDGGGCLIEPADLIAPGQAQRLAEVRKASGGEIPELAGLLGISYEAYEELERSDEAIVVLIRVTAPSPPILLGRPLRSAAGLPNRRRLVHDPAKTPTRLARERTEIVEPPAELFSGRPGQLRERVESAFHYVGCVVGLTGQILSLPRERALALVHVAETRLVKPVR